MGTNGHDIHRNMIKSDSQSPFVHCPIITLSPTCNHLVRSFSPSLSVGKELAEAREQVREVLLSCMTITPTQPLFATDMNRLIYSTSQPLSFLVVRNFTTYVFCPYSFDLKLSSFSP